MFSHKHARGARKLILRMSFALALGASLTGCTVGPKYHRRTVKLQPFHNAPSIETRTAGLPTPPLDQWWTGFHDPVLTRIVQRALDQNLDLAAAMARVQQARALAQGAGARRLPSGNLYGSTTSLSQSTESVSGRLASHFAGYDRHPAGEYLLYVERPRTGPIGPDYFPDLTYYPRVRDGKAATVIRLGEAQKLTRMNFKLLPPQQRIP